MKKLLVIMLCLAMVFAFAACTEAPADTDGDDVVVDSDAAYIQDKGTVVIGITIFEPMNYYDENNELIGFDTEFAEAVFAKLGIEPVFEVINWETKEVELNAKTLDCLWNGVTVDDERRENMAFSKSYIKNMQAAVINVSNSEKYIDLASMADATIVAEAGSAGEKAAQTEAALATANYIPVQAQASALLEVKMGTADVAFLDYVMAKASLTEASDYSDLMIVPGVELAVEEYAVAFRLNSDMVDLVNQAIDELVADGTLAALAEKYGLSDQLIFNQVADDETAE